MPNAKSCRRLVTKVQNYGLRKGEAAMCKCNRLAHVLEKRVEVRQRQPQSSLINLDFKRRYTCAVPVIRIRQNSSLGVSN